jgi:hypothetical protein
MHRMRPDWPIDRRSRESRLKERGLEAKGSGGGRKRADENVHELFATERKPTAADLDQTGSTATEHLEMTADANAKFGQPTNPGRLAGDIADLGPFAWSKTLKGEHGGVAHEQPCRREHRGLLRLNLNLSVDRSDRMSRGGWQLDRGDGGI